MKAAINRTVLTEEEFACMAGVKVATIRRWVRDRQVPAVNLPNGACLFDIATIYASLRDQQTAKNQWYLLIVQGDVEPTIAGPFDTEEDMQAYAREWRKSHGTEDGLYGMQALAKPAVWAFPAATFEEGEDT